ncbi:MAG: SDR family NAD(P)-dependent oxidoreductase [Gemmatimonadaceae bacterium]
MNRQLENKVAIVTGGGTGIGEAVCRKFARDGARVLSTRCHTCGRREAMLFARAPKRA